MRYRLLGKTGVRISEVALGTMTFGEDWGWEAPADVSARMLDLFADAGGNVIDTADVYTSGTSETILGGPPRQDPLPDIDDPRAQAVRRTTTGT